MVYDIGIIGSGPGGYVAAEMAARKGLSVILFEKDELGGTCLNKGCIPTKVLLHASDLIMKMQEANMYGIEVEKHLNNKVLSSHKDQIVLRLREDIANLMRVNQIEVVKGKAIIKSQNVISCNDNDYECTNIIIAVGAATSVPPIEGITSDGVYISDDILGGEIKSFESLAIIGGGVIAVELASFYMAMGCKVTIFEAEQEILPKGDKEVSKKMESVFRKRGAIIETGVVVNSIVGRRGNLNVNYLKEGELHSVNVEAVICATGRHSNLEGLFAAGFNNVKYNNFGIWCDLNGKTTVDNIFVIGDARENSIQLAHAASAQARNVIEYISGNTKRVDESLIPNCIYCFPEIAFVGITDSQAKEQGIEVKVVKSLTRINAKSMIEGSIEGFVKIIIDAQTNVILGAQLMCDRATDLISELSVAIENELTVEELLSTVHPHPTIAELIYDTIGKAENK